MSAGLAPADAQGVNANNRTTWILLPLIAALLLAFPASSGAATCPGSEVQAQADQSTQEFETTVVCLLNRARGTRGLPPLRKDARLAEAARGHSSSMSSQGFFGHDSLSGSSFVTRIENAGYIRGAASWFVGENIAWGSSTLGTPQALMTAWMQSSPHRRNILNRRFREVGPGVVWGSPNDSSMPAAATVTTDFGALNAH
ncbi:MAG: CAP domain-containing protein [Solirubrobacterales bacterium]